MVSQNSARSFADFNAQTVDEIVAKTGYPVVDRAALLEDLLACYGKVFRLFPKQPKSIIRRQQARRGSMRRAMTRLADLIEEDNADRGTAREILVRLIENMDQTTVCEMTAPWPGVLVGLLRSWAFELERREMEPADWVKKNRERYSLAGYVVMRKLTGECLAEIYKRHFKRKAAASRPFKDSASTAPTGPYVRFVKAVLVAWKLDYSEEAIKAALRLAKEKK